MVVVHRHLMVVGDNLLFVVVAIDLEKKYFYLIC
jgi:hypothetical protein